MHTLNDLIFCQQFFYFIQTEQVNFYFLIVVKLLFPFITATGCEEHVHLIVIGGGIRGGFPQVFKMGKPVTGFFQELTCNRGFQ